MKNLQIAPASGKNVVARPLVQGCFAALLAGLISISLPVAISRAQPAADEGGAEVLVRGPVHEAFAGVVTYNPEPGIVVKTRPPELIEELPPEEKPEGDGVAWIPGYWGWDDERNDYLWISGTWRVLPPGREWMAGYWREAEQGYQWISGYWADAAAEETTYLPPPPATLEVGANIAAPSDDYGWTPGSWMWHEGRYAWRAGYWAEGRADWVWSPSYYVWTPRGVIFVEGYWDYPLEQRGVLFAPVYYQSREYARRGYSYSPRIALNLSIFNDHLFLRPSYQHYYFGDYYDTRYERGGFYASFSFQSGRHGFDPFYSYDRWEHRRDRDWENRVQASYRDRRENVAARPPRTWAAQVTINARPLPSGQTRLTMAAPVALLAHSVDHPVRFQPVAQGDRQSLAQRGREVQQSRDQRRTVEAKAAAAPGSNAAAAVAPARGAGTRSPIAARPTGPQGKAPAPPPQSPQSGARGQSRSEAPGRPPGTDRPAIPPASRPAGPDRNATADRNPPVARTTNASPAAAPRPGQPVAPVRDEPSRNARQAATPVPPDAGERNRDSAENSKAMESPRPNPGESADERRNVTAAKALEETRRKGQESQQKAQREAADRASPAAAKAHEESPQRAGGAAADAPPPPVERRDAAPVKAAEPGPRDPPNTRAAPRPDAEPPPAAQVREEPQRRAPDAQVKAQQDAAKRAAAAAKAKPVPKAKPAQDDADDAGKEKDKARGN